MSDPDDTASRRMVAFGSGLDEKDAAAVHNILSLLVFPNIRRFIFAGEPMKSSGKVKIHSAEALFADRLVSLRNMATLAIPNGVQSDIFRDGFELLALESLANRQGDDCFILIRGNCDIQAPVLQWLQNQPHPSGLDAPYLCLPTGSELTPSAIAFRADHPRLDEFIRISTDLYCSGAILGLPDYSLRSALSQSWSAVLRL